MEDYNGYEDVISRRARDIFVYFRYFSGEKPRGYVMPLAGRRLQQIFLSPPPPPPPQHPSCLSTTYADPSPTPPSITPLHIPPPPSPPLQIIPHVPSPQPRLHRGMTPLLVICPCATHARTYACTVSASLCRHALPLPPLATFNPPRPCPHAPYVDCTQS